MLTRSDKQESTTKPAQACTPEADSLKVIDWGDLRRAEPISRVFGFDRGKPVDRYYIERFLAAHAGDIRGRVLEIGDDAYTRHFGGARVSRSDVLHANGDNRKATIVADLTHASALESDTFDCVICTQTLQYIYDLPAAIRTIYRILKPDGTLLATVPGISQISRYDMDRWGEYWRFTTLSLRRVLSEVFPGKNVEVEAFGNVIAAVAFLHGLSATELSEVELGTSDSDYELLIRARAVRPGNES